MKTLEQEANLWLMRKKRLSARKRDEKSKLLAEFAKHVLESLVMSDEAIHAHADKASLVQKIGDRMTYYIGCKAGMTFINNEIKKQLDETQD